MGAQPFVSRGYTAFLSGCSNGICMHKMCLSRHCLTQSSVHIAHVSSSKYLAQTLKIKQVQWSHPRRTIFLEAIFWATLTCIKCRWLVDGLGGCVHTLGFPFAFWRLDCLPHISCFKHYQKRGRKNREIPVTVDLIRWINLPTRTFPKLYGTIQSIAACLWDFQEVLVWNLGQYENME